SRDRASAVTALGWSASWWNCRPVAASQRRTVWSSLPETRVLPSRDRTRQDTVFECPFHWRTSRPVATSHKRIDRALLPQATRRPSGKKTTELTQSSCPRNAWTSWPVATSQRRTQWLVPPIAVEASFVPSGENARQEIAPGGPPGRLTSFLRFSKSHKWM